MKKSSALIQAISIIVFMLGFRVLAYGGISLQINNARVDLDNQTLSLHGVNFDSFTPPTVTIGDILLSQCSYEPTLIECSLDGTPAMASGGTWKVTISAGNSPHANASIDVFMPIEVLAQQCLEGDLIECYSGDPATREISGCQTGFRTCQLDGTWSACQGEVIPQTQSCNSGLDEDCDTLVDYADPDCAALCAGPANAVCGTQCVDISSDPLNCGACDNPCGVDRVCISGSCALSCTPPSADCGVGTCVDTSSDPLNCGACNNSCGVNQVCISGSCASQ